MKAQKTSRNSPCPCGSGKKYKNCCERKAAARANSQARWILVLIAGILLLGVIGFVSSLATADRSPAPRPNQVWSPEHGHWHDAP